MADLTFAQFVAQQNLTPDQSAALLAITTTATRSAEDWAFAAARILADPITQWTIDSGHVDGSIIMTAGLDGYANAFVGAVPIKTNTGLHWAKVLLSGTNAQRLAFNTTTTPDPFLWQETDGIHRLLTFTPGVGWRISGSGVDPDYVPPYVAPPPPDTGAY